MTARTSGQRRVRALLLFVAYSTTGMLGLAVHTVAGFATLVWPPSGIALAALLIWGRQLWPVITVAALTVNLLTGAPLVAALVIAAGNTLEALGARWALVRTGFDPQLIRVRDVLKLVVLGAGLSPVVSATLGVASLWATGAIGSTEVTTSWGVWWLGDALGCLLLASLLLVWHAHPRVQLSGPKWLEAAALLAGLGLALFLIFIPWEAHPHGRLYLLYPVLIWAALRFGERGVVTLMFLVSVGSVWATTAGFGPFAQAGMREALIPQQGFTAITSIALLILSAAIAERNNAIGVSAANASASMFLADAGGVLSASLDHELTLRNLARLVVPTLADHCVIDIREPAGFRRIAEVSTDPVKEALLRRLRPYALAAAQHGGYLEVLATGRSVVVPRMDDAALRKISQNEEHFELARRLDPASSLFVPIRAGTRLLGAMILGANDARGPYQPQDIAVAEELGVRAGLAIENARLYEEAKQAVELRDEFLAVAAHELRTPLTALELQVGLLSRLATRREAIPTESFDSRIHALLRQLSRFSTLIDNLLDVSRLTSGRMSYEFEEVELVQLTREVASRFHEQAERAGSQLSVVVEAEPITGQWDRLRLEQVITNLLSNAVKYGGGKPIRVRLTADAQAARLSVIDQGVGIEAQDHARIFERFERAASPKNFGGLGLGLWIVKKLVTGMGATIEVDSRPGEGSTFTLGLPRSRP